MAYLILGAGLWVLVPLSGIHASLAGVALALTIPLTPSPAKPDDAHPSLHVLEHALQRWVAFLIIPVFGFANAGVPFAGMSFGQLTDPVPLGVALGLFIGKQVGVFGFAAVVIRMGWAHLPADATWLQLYGLALLWGIGFTMSLFFGLLALPDSALLQDETKLGVLLGSLLSAVAGAVLLRSVPASRRSHG